MITCRITDDDGRELALVRMERLGSPTEMGDYSFQLGVNTGEGWAVYQRSVDQFPRRRYNVLALLRVALSSLEEKELSLDRDPDQSPPPDARRTSDLVRRLFRGM